MTPKADPMNEEVARLSGQNQSANAPANSGMAIRQTACSGTLNSLCDSRIMGAVAKSAGTEKTSA